MSSSLAVRAALAVALGCGSPSVVIAPPSPQPRVDDSDAALSAACDKGDGARCHALGRRFAEYGSPRYNPKQAVALYRRGCDAQSDKSCLSLAAATAMGFGVPRDVQAAHLMTERLCTKGYADACTNLGADYLNANGVPADMSRGAAYVRKGCEGGDDTGCMVLAFAFVRRALPDGDASLAFEEPCTSPRRCTLVGAKYLGGAGTSRDGARAVKLFDDACTKAYLPACFFLGMGAALGADGAPPDLARAATLFRRACDGRIAIACHELGVAYAEGKGVPKDTKKAIELYDGACKEGSLYSCMSLGVIYMLGDGVPRDVERSVTILARACAGGIAQACTNLGVLYATDSAIQNRTRAMGYFESGCSGGDASGCKDRDYLARCQQGAPDACSAFNHIKGVP